MSNFIPHTRYNKDGSLSRIKRDITNELEESIYNYMLNSDRYVHTATTLTKALTGQRNFSEKRPTKEYEQIKYALECMTERDLVFCEELDHKMRATVWILTERVK